MYRGGARRPALIQLANRYVDLALQQELLQQPPVDLYSIAHARRIHTIEFRSLLADGCLLADKRGFTVILNDSDLKTVDPASGEKALPLNVKQRFTLAHEIAHTLTYDLTRTQPREKEETLRLIVEA